MDRKQKTRTGSFRFLCFRLDSLFLLRLEGRTLEAERRTEAGCQAGREAQHIRPFLVILLFLFWNPFPGATYRSHRFRLEHIANADGLAFNQRFQAIDETTEIKREGPEGAGGEHEQNARCSMILPGPTVRGQLAVKTAPTNR